jgi:hypothetical protein
VGSKHARHKGIEAAEGDAKCRHKKGEIYADTARSSPKSIPTPTSPKETQAAEEVTSKKNSSL